MRRRSPYFWHRLLIGFGLTGIVWFVPYQVSQAEDLVITATVTGTGGPANPIVQFKGRASLDTNVNFIRDGSLIHSVATDTAAKFDVTLSDQPTGLVTYEIRATDSTGRQHASTSFALNLAAGSTTVLSGIFLGPTIALDKSSIKLGETVTAFGKTAPSSTVMLTVSSVPQTYNVAVDAQGNWTKVIDSDDTGTGSHSAVAEAVSSDNTLSESSLPVSFTVNPLGQCDGKPTADINCDGRVSLTDFSVLLYYWLRTNPSNARADINGDGRVTIVDFSIMLFQWSR